MRHFELEEIPIRVRSPESNGRIERYHCNEERLHSALKYLRPVDYYRGNPEALLAERKRKLREAAARRKEVNRGKKEARLVNGAPVPGARTRSRSDSGGNDLDKN